VKRPYVKQATDWCDYVLRQWSEQVRTRPRETVVVTPGGAMPSNMGIGGAEPEDTKDGRGVTARGFPVRRISSGAEPKGYMVLGLTGPAAIADRVVLHIAGVDARCAWTLRAEYGLVPEVPTDADSKAKAAHLGVYIDGRVWPASAYTDRLARGRQMFAVGYLCAH